MAFLKQYYEETNEWPSYDTVYNNENIGGWITNQRRLFKLNLLSSKRIKMLEDVCYPLKNYKMRVYENRWDFMLNLMKQYYEETNKWPSYGTVYNNENIGVWIIIQKTKYNRNELSTDRIKKLEEIGYPIERSQSEIDEDRWIQMFNLLKQYYEETNEWPSNK